MSIELFTAEKLLEMALGAVVGDATSGLTKSLWTRISDRLRKNQPVIEAEIVELEQNPTREKLKQLEPFLQVEMHKDRLFAEEITKLAREIAKAKGGDKIAVREMKAETGGVAAGKIDEPGSRFGGSDTNINLGKD